MAFGVFWGRPIMVCDDFKAVVLIYNICNFVAQFAECKTLETFFEVAQLFLCAVVRDVGKVYQPQVYVATNAPANAVRFRKCCATGKNKIFVLYTKERK